MDLIFSQLEPLGFRCEYMDAGPDHFRVRNLWAVRPGRSGKVLAFAGHTDVVPTGPLTQWESDPFTPSIRDGQLFGRGACDMKSSLAAMLVATREFLTSTPDPDLGLAFLLTSDEEGPARDGTVVVCQQLKARGQAPDFCIVGEPTSIERTGDMLKNGRRGSINARLTVLGIQAHIAYPHLGRNPVHQLAPALTELAAEVWDQGNAYFPPTSFQVSNLHAGTGASNIIPGECILDFNFRFGTESTVESLQQRTEAILQRHGLEYRIEWNLSGQPFLTEPGLLLDEVVQAITEVTGQETVCSTTGGTSDGRFIAQICPEVIELGPPNASIHKVNEQIALTELAPLKQIYRRTLERLNARMKA